MHRDEDLNSNPSKPNPVEQVFILNFHNFFYMCLF